jgi:AGZA family xanthine/uracil permease-like MFS transporter
MLRGYEGRVGRFFRLADHGSTVRAEVLGGATTFAAMAYIIVANPAILGLAGLPVGPSTIATVVVAAVFSILMGVYANRPIAVAPYMGENAFLAFGLAALGIGWEQRLGAVFVAGVLFLALTLIGVRAWLSAAISPSLKHAFAAGIGLFLMVLGLYQAGLVTAFTTGMPTPASPTLPRPDVPVKLGDLRDIRVQLAVFGFLVTAGLLCRGVRGAILIGMAATALAGYLAGVGAAPTRVLALPFTGDYSLAPVALKLDVPGVLRVELLPVLLTLVLMSLLDTLGTLAGVGAAAGLLDSRGDLPDAHKPMLVDAAACVGAALVGTSTSGAYIESAAGVRAGARTGLAAVTTGLLFVASLFFLPLAEPLQQLAYVYAPALVAIGGLMLASARRVEFDDPTEAVPAGVAIVLVAFTYNIANGLAGGLAVYPILKVMAGRGRELSVGSVALGLIALAYFVFGLPH